MIKKITILSLFTATLMQAEELRNKGVFVGVDLTHVNAKMYYTNNASASSTAIPTSPYTNELQENQFSYKIGYQYYFTRVYARYATFNYKDEARKRYKIDGKLYELNVDYLPVFYKEKNNHYAIKGIFGVGVGYNSSKLTTYNPFLLPSGVNIDGTQNYMEYGYQLGFGFEFSFGLGVEFAYRTRYGNLQEYTDGTNNATFNLKTQSIYGGLNYIF